MEYYPDPNQVLLLWKLAVNDGAAWKADIKPAHIADKAKRVSLQRFGLIAEETRQRVTPGKRASRGLFLTLEDKGWAWLAEHLDAPISRSAAAADVLQTMLRMLQQHLDRHHLALADFVSATSESETATHEVVDGDVENQIIAAYETLAGKRSNSRVRLKDLRKELIDVPRQQIDRVLTTMTADGRIVLNRLDNPHDITAEDEAAKLLSPLGDPRHIMHMEIPAHV